RPAAPTHPAHTPPPEPPSPPPPPPPSPTRRSSDLVADHPRPARTWLVGQTLQSGGQEPGPPFRDRLPAHPHPLSDLTVRAAGGGDRKSTRLNSSHLGISYAVFCVKKKKSPTAGRPI